MVNKVNDTCSNFIGTVVFLVYARLDCKCELMLAGTKLSACEWLHTQEATGARPQFTVAVIVVAVVVDVAVAVENPENLKLKGCRRTGSGG